MSGSPDRTSLLGSTLGSFKDRLSRNSSTKSNRSSTNGSPAAPPSSNANNPFNTRSPATRRPREDPPPPSYNEAVATPATASGATSASSPAPSRRSAVVSAQSASTAEDPYAFLSAFDTVFLIDDSGSMAGRSWRETQDALRAIAPICASHDADGLDVYFLNATNPRPSPAGGFANVLSACAVEGLFRSVRPGGGTPTGTRIQAILGPYVTAFERAVAAHGGDADATGIKPVNLIVVTDGVPTDDPESVLLGLARRLDRINAPPFQVGVQFFQVGREPGAGEALRELDDCLGGEAAQRGLRDMVDTTTWDGAEGSQNVLTADGILKAVLGGVVKRLDRRRVGVEETRRN